MRRIAVLPVLVSILLTGCVESETSGRAIQKSMEPTIRSGEIIAIDAHSYDVAEPQVGDIISLRAPANALAMVCAVRRRPRQPCRRSASRLSEEWLIKRIVAGPGQRVAIAGDGHARVDGVLANEPYIIACAPNDYCRLPRAITVPPGQYFVLGDNRPYSSDSRYWGPVSREAIEGLVTPPAGSRR